MRCPASPIAVLDSGLGGLTVAKAIREALPNEKILYFGDTARVPYGCKSPETVTRFMREIIRYLQPQRPKHIVMACNTATALSMPAIKAEFAHLSISGVIEPGAKAAAEAAGPKAHPLIAVIATQATVDSQAYVRAIIRRRHYARVLVLATPLLVPIIEDGRGEEDPLVRVALEQYLKPLIDRAPGVLVLGCTHYPVLKESIAKMMGQGCRVIDSAEQCAQDVARRLTVEGIAQRDRCIGSLRCFVTDDPLKFQRLARRFVGAEIDLPTLVSTEQLAMDPPALVVAAA
jgi:glutamate racemase